MYNFKLIHVQITFGAWSAYMWHWHVQSRVLFWAKASLVPQLTSWGKYRTAWVACRATRTPDCTKFRPTSLVEKPQKVLFLWSTAHHRAYSCQVTGNLRDAILFEPWIGLHENATAVWRVSLFTLPYCEDDVTVWQRVSVHAAVQSDGVPLALHQHDQLFCAHWGALAGNIAHLQLYTSPSILMHWWNRSNFTHHIKIAINVCSISIKHFI